MSEQQAKTTHKRFPWQLPLTVIFLCFGILIVAQYRTHVAYSDSLESQSYNDLSALALSLMDNKSLLQAEVVSLRNELAETEDSINSGLDLAATREARITSLHAAIGAQAVEGPGISVTITSDSSQLIAYDLIDIVNELFVSGAEAVAINNVRISARTQIADQDNGYGNFSIVIDGQTLLSPVVIRAIGNASTLETGLTYSGGIIDALRILHIFPIVKQEENINIPAAAPNPFLFAIPAVKEEAEAVTP